MEDTLCLNKFLKNKSKEIFANSFVYDSLQNKMFANTFADKNSQFFFNMCGYKKIYEQIYIQCPFFITKGHNYLKILLKY